MASGAEIGLTEFGQSRRELIRMGFLDRHTAQYGPMTGLAVYTLVNVFAPMAGVTHTLIHKEADDNIFRIRPYRMMK